MQIYKIIRKHKKHRTIYTIQPYKRKLKDTQECDKGYYYRLLRLYSAGDRQTKRHVKHRRMLLTEAPKAPGQRPVSAPTHQREIQHGRATNRSRAFDMPAATRLSYGTTPSCPKHRICSNYSPTTTFAIVIKLATCRGNHNIHTEIHAVSTYDFHTQTFSSSVSMFYSHRRII